MSYLLDALRKAEKERNLGRVPDLSYSLDEQDRGQHRSTPAWLLAVIVGLVVINLLALGSFWWLGGSDDDLAPPAVNAMTSQPDPAGTTNRLQTTPADTPASVVASDTAKNDGLEPAVQTPESASEPPQVQYPAATNPAQQKRLPGLTEAQVAASSRAFQEAETTAPAPPEEIPHLKALAPTQRTGMPALEINGHLYSSIPGRSFVLVNGRRMHEGQRLPEGPAVVIIDEEGAIFKLGETRFRLDAPR